MYSFGAFQSVVKIICCMVLTVLQDSCSAVPVCNVVAVHEGNTAENGPRLLTSNVVYSMEVFSAATSATCTLNPYSGVEGNPVTETLLGFDAGEQGDCDNNTADWRYFAGFHLSWNSAITLDTAFTISRIDGAASNDTDLDMVAVFGYTNDSTPVQVHPAVSLGSELTSAQIPPAIGSITPPPGAPAQPDVVTSVFRKNTAGDDIAFAATAANTATFDMSATSFLTDLYVFYGFQKATNPAQFIYIGLIMSEINMCAEQIPMPEPTSSPTASPTLSPTSVPSASPTRSPTSSPTLAPTLAPITDLPSNAPTMTHLPTGQPLSPTTPFAASPNNNAPDDGGENNNASPSSDPDNDGDNVFFDSGDMMVFIISISLTICMCCIPVICFFSRRQRSKHRKERAKAERGNDTVRDQRIPEVKKRAVGSMDLNELNERIKTVKSALRWEFLEGNIEEERRLKEKLKVLEQERDRAANAAPPIARYSRAQPATRSRVLKSPRSPRRSALALSPRPSTAVRSPRSPRTTDHARSKSSVSIASSHYGKIHLSSPSNTNALNMDVDDVSSSLISQITWECPICHCFLPLKLTLCPSCVQPSTSQYHVGKISRANLNMYHGTLARMTSDGNYIQLSLLDIEKLASTDGRIYEDLHLKDATGNFVSVEVDSLPSNTLYNSLPPPPVGGEYCTISLSQVQHYGKLLARKTNDAYITLSLKEVSELKSGAKSTSSIYSDLHLRDIKGNYQKIEIDGAYGETSLYEKSPSAANKNRLAYGETSLYGKSPSPAKYGQTSLYNKNPVTKAKVAEYGKCAVYQKAPAPSNEMVKVEWSASVDEWIRKMDYPNCMPLYQQDPNSGIYFPLTLISSTETADNARTLTSSSAPAVGSVYEKLSIVARKSKDYGDIPGKPVLRRVMIDED